MRWEVLKHLHQSKKKTLSPAPGRTHTGPRLLSLKDTITIFGHKAEHHGIHYHNKSFQDSITSEKSDFTAVAGSKARHSLLSPLVDSCYVAYQLKSITEFSLLQRFQQSLVLVSLTPLHRPFSSPQITCGKLGMLADFHPESSSCISPSLFPT